MTDATRQDDSAARQSAQDAWLTATEQHFITACADWRNRPSASVEAVRKVLEGWVHVTLLALDPEFRTHERAELHRAQLGKYLGRASKHLPPHLRLHPEALKLHSDPAHHNQGELACYSTTTARAELAKLSEVMEWMYASALQRRPPDSIDNAIRDVRGQETPRAAQGQARRWRSALAVVGAAMLLVAATVMVVGSNDENPGSVGVAIAGPTSAATEPGTEQPVGESEVASRCEAPPLHFLQLGTLTTAEDACKQRAALRIDDAYVMGTDDERKFVVVRGPFLPDALEKAQSAWNATNAGDKFPAKITEGKEYGEPVRCQR